MRNYRKLPVVIKAEQWLQFGDVPEAPIRKSDFNGDCYIATMEGEYKMLPGHWVIKGVKGEYYPCDPDVFVKSYEPTDQETVSYGLGQK